MYIPAWHFTGSAGPDVRFFESAGLGDSGAGWADVAEYDIGKRMRNTKIVLPTAPQVCILLPVPLLRTMMMSLCITMSVLRVAVQQGSRFVDLVASICAETHHPEHGHADERLV